MYMILLAKIVIACLITGIGATIALALFLFSIQDFVNITDKYEKKEVTTFEVYCHFGIYIIFAIAILVIAFWVCKLDRGFLRQIFQTIG